MGAGSEVRVLLIGLMGAGKSSVGTALARTLGLDFLDNDALLRQQEGLDTVQLSLKGRDYLHAAERRQLLSVIRREGAFVAGAAASVADRVDDCRLIRRACTVVYLHAEPSVLAERVTRDPARPWVGEDPLAVITQMYELRDHVFRATAHLVVESDQQLEPLLSQIHAHLAQRFPWKRPPG